MKKADFLLIVILLVLMTSGLLSYIQSCSIKTSVQPKLYDSRTSVDVPVIMYHGIAPNGSSENEYLISESRFESDLKWLKDNSYTTIFPSQLVDYVKKNIKLPLKPVILSFDDGFYNNYLYAYPLLNKYNMKAVIALIGIESDQTSDDIYRIPKTCNLSWGEVALMSQSGIIEFANHSYDLHTISKGRKGADRKPGETQEEYRQTLLDDLGKNQEIIKTATGYAPQVFAWPYGAYPIDGSSIPILQEIGFEVSFVSYQHTSTIKQGDPSTLFNMGRYLRIPAWDITNIIPDKQK